jgi:hypothetical protein
MRVDPNRNCARSGAVYCLLETGRKVKREAAQDLFARPPAQ